MNLEALLKERGCPDWIYKNILFGHVAGSQLYGTNRPNSDRDERYVVLAPKEYWIGNKEYELTEIVTDELDIVIWDFRKFLKSIVKCAPNVLETLYAPASATLMDSECWNKMLPKIKGLVSQEAYKTVGGYSQSQMKKMVVKHGNKTGRQEIVKMLGFDTKFVAHAFRLLGQGKELLKTGEIKFPRPEADWLKNIRDGKVYFRDEMERCLKDWETEDIALSEALNSSSLPKSSDADLHNSILMEVFDNYVNKKSQLPPAKARRLVIP